MVPDKKELDQFPLHTLKRKYRVKPKKQPSLLYFPPVSDRIQPLALVLKRTRSERQCLELVAEVEEPTERRTRHKVQSLPKVQPLQFRTLENRTSTLHVSISSRANPLKEKSINRGSQIQAREEQLPRLTRQLFVEISRDGGELEQQYVVSRKVVKEICQFHHETVEKHAKQILRQSQLKALSLGQMLSHYRYVVRKSGTPELQLFCEKLKTYDADWEAKVAKALTDKDAQIQTTLNQLTQAKCAAQQQAQRYSQRNAALQQIVSLVQNGQSITDSLQAVKSELLQYKQKSQSQAAALRSAEAEVQRLLSQCKQIVKLRKDLAAFIQTKRQKQSLERALAQRETQVLQLREIIATLRNQANIKQNELFRLEQQIKETEEKSASLLNDKRSLNAKLTQLEKELESSLTFQLQQQLHRKELHQRIKEISRQLEFSAPVLFSKLQNEFGSLSKQEVYELFSEKLEFISYEQRRKDEVYSELTNFLRGRIFRLSRLLKQSQEDRSALADRLKLHSRAIKAACTKEHELSGLAEKQLRELAGQSPCQACQSQWVRQASGWKSLLRTTGLAFEQLKVLGLTQ